VPQSTWALPSGLRADSHAYAARIPGPVWPALRRIGSDLKSSEIVDRAESLNCHWCHVAAGSLDDRFPVPFSLLQQNISEKFRERGEAGLRYRISPAMRDRFLPDRMENLHRFLATVQ
jgi:hypothetical protein